jgi:predicted nucleotidyltransferase
MVAHLARELALEKAREYVRRLRENDIAVWQVYLFGSFAKGSQDADSDIDLAVFLDREEIDGFDEGVRLTRLRRGIDTRIEPHVFARTEMEDGDPVVREILRSGQRID